MYFEFQKVKAIVPYVGAICIFCGFYKLKIIYSSFGIDISNFIGTSEILTSFLPDLTEYVLIILGIMIFKFLLMSKKDIQSKESEVKNLITMKNGLVRLYAHLKMNTIVLIPLIMYSLMTIIFYFFFPNKIPSSNFLFFALLGILVFNILLLEFERKFLLVYKKRIDSSIINLVIVVSLFFLYTIQTASVEIREIRDGNGTRISFEYETDQIKSTKKMLYIGKTLNYIFMFNRASNETSVYQISQSKNIVIQEN